MQIVGHFFIAHVAMAAIWICAGALVHAVKSIALLSRKTGFIVSFILLGMLTSLGEISVALNSSLEGVPQISAGNLVGASLVLLLFVIPLLAIFGNGIHLRKTLTSGNLILALFVIALPAIVVLDGVVSWNEGLLLLIAYGALITSVLRENKSGGMASASPKKKTRILFDITKVVFGAIVIFFAGKILVNEVIYFAEILSAPASLIALIALSLGTNIPELTIAIRAVLEKESDIAFGDYIGSAAANSLIFGLVALLGGGFLIESSLFVGTAILSICGFTLLYILAKSRNTISRKEGFVLIAFYGAFLLIQTINILSLSGK
jgi:cation:H+ antiporter